MGTQQLYTVVLWLLALTTALNLLLPLLLSPVSKLHPDVYPLNRYSPPGQLREWPVAPLRRVALTIEDTVNYQLDTPEGEVEWESIIPPGGGYVYLPSPATSTHSSNITRPPRRYRLSMFHALSCLNTLRLSVLARTRDRTHPPSDEAARCLSYMRQMILCRSDTHLESVRSEYGGKSVQPFVTHEDCRDWSAVYEELEKLYGEAGE